MNAEWFPMWLKKHLERHLTAGLQDPVEGGEMYEGWRAEFEHLGITERVATIASIRTLTRAPKLQWHFSTLMRFARSLKEPSTAPSSMEAARNESGHCPHCEGMGAVSVVLGENPASYAAFCICSYGRFQLAQVSKDNPQMRLVDLNDVLAGKKYLNRDGQVVTFRLYGSDYVNDESGGSRVGGGDTGRGNPGRRIPGGAGDARPGAGRGPAAVQGPGTQPRGGQPPVRSPHSR